jgi:diphthine-ammonia ligase
MVGTALVSGGKDSVYATYLAECQGWPVDELVTIRPADPDSMMFHTPNLDLVRLQAEAWGKTHRSVTSVAGDDASEVAALAAAIGDRPGPVVSGAILSSYQWSRTVRVADRIGRRVYAPLWRVDPLRVVREEIAAGLDIRFVHLAAEGLPPDLLGARLDLGALERLATIGPPGRGPNVAGEGGEYETLVVDAPFFSSRIVLDYVERRRTAGTARLDVRRAHLEPKGSATRPRERP